MAKDFLVDTTGDLGIVNGDLMFGESDAQHIEDIISFNPGEVKHSPLVGVGIVKYLRGSGIKNELERSLKMQLEADGFRVNNLALQSNNAGGFDILTDAEL